MHNREKELTVTALVLGVVISIVFGAANAYLGLRVGMTISASVPAAVISMGVLRYVLRRDSILENNMVQTIGSAGESLAAGAIFTLPALYLWAQLRWAGSSRSCVPFRSSCARSRVHPEKAQRRKGSPGRPSVTFPCGPC